MTVERWRLRRPPLPLRPVRELEEMRRRFDEDFVQPALHAVWEHIPEEMKSWAPLADVYEKGDSIIIKIEIPGMKLEDIDLNVTEDVLTVRGERKNESGVKSEDYDRFEISYGSFYRSISLPCNIDNRSSEAVYQDGILTITLQKAPGEKPKKVSIQVKKGTD